MHRRGRDAERVGFANSGGLVFVDESAEAISTGDFARSGRAGEPQHWPLAVGRQEVQRPMRAVAVVVLDEDAEHSLEVAPVENEEPVETRGAGGADEALCYRVRLRRSHRCLDDLDAFAGEDSVEGARVSAVAVANQEPKPRRLLLERPRELAGPLADPRSGRVSGAAGEVDASAGLASWMKKRNGRTAGARSS
jgi:hypothetical protein